MSIPVVFLLGAEVVDGSKSAAAIWTRERVRMDAGCDKEVRFRSQGFVTMRARRRRSIHLVVVGFHLVAHERHSVMALWFAGPSREPRSLPRACVLAL